MRYTSHKSTECTKPTSREKSASFTAIALAELNVTSAGSMASAVDWSEIDEETQPVRKKSRTKRAKKRKRTVILSSDEETTSDKWQTRSSTSGTVDKIKLSFKSY